MSNRREFELAMKLTAALGPKFNSSFKGAMETTNKLQGSINNLRKAQGDISAYQKAESAIKDLREEKARLESASGDNTAAIEKVNEKLAAQEANLKEVGGRLREAGIDTNRLAEENARLQTAQERVTRSQEDLARATKAVADNKQALKETQKQLLFTMGKVAAAGVAVYKAFVKPAADFEQAMSGVKAQTGMTAGEINELGGAFKAMGRNSTHGALDISAAFAAVAVRGQDVAHSTELMRTAMVLADATGGNLQNTAYFLGSYLMKIGKDSSYAERYINVFSKTVQGTGIGLNTLQDYLFRANASLQLAGISGTEATAIFGNLYQAGIRGANAYSGIQQAIQSLMLPSAGAADALETLGINVQAMKKSGYGMTEIMFQVGDALEYVEDNTERLALMQDLFTQQTAFAFADELFTQRDTLRELIPELYKAGDAAKKSGIAYEMAANRTDNLNSQMQRARNATEAFRIAVGNVLLPVLTEAVKVKADIIGRVAEFAQENPRLVKTIFKVAAALAAVKIALLVGKLAFLQMKGGILGVKKAFALLNAKRMLAEVSKLGGATGKTGNAFSKFGKIFRVLAKKMLPVIIIVGVLAAVFGKMKGGAEDSGGIIETLRGVFEKIRPVLQMVMERIGELAKALLPILADMAKKVVGVLGELLAAVLPVLISLFETLLPVLKEIVFAVFDVFVDILDALLPLFIELVKSVFPILVELIQILLPVIKELVTKAFAVFVEILKTLLPIIGQLIEAVLPILVNLINDLLPIITQLVKTLLPIFVEVLKLLLPIIKNLIEAVLPILMGLLEALGPIITVLAGIFEGVLGAAIQNITNIIDGVMRVLGGLIDFITGVFTGNWTQAWEGMVNIFGGIFDTLGALIKAPMNAVIGIINGAIRGINKLNITIPDWVPVIGGRGFSIDIPKIPFLERGSNRTPDTFIAGDVGGKGGELVTGARGRKVFTAAQTAKIFNNINKARTISKLIPSIVSDSDTPTIMQQPLPAFPASSGGRTLIIENKPNIYVNGNVPGDLDEKLKKSNENLFQMFKEWLRQQAEDERRTVYD